MVRLVTQNLLVVPVLYKRLVLHSETQLLVIIQGASRSPPGQDPKQCHFLEFSITWDSFLPFLDPLWRHIYNLGTTIGALWVNFRVTKTNWGAGGATRGAKVRSPNINSLVWIPFGRFCSSMKMKENAL